MWVLFYHGHRQVSLSTTSTVLEEPHTPLSWSVSTWSRTSTISNSIACNNEENGDVVFIKRQNRTPEQNVIDSKIVNSWHFDAKFIAPHPDRKDNPLYEYRLWSKFECAGENSRSRKKSRHEDGWYVQKGIPSHYPSSDLDFKNLIQAWPIRNYVGATKTCRWRRWEKGQRAMCSRGSPEKMVHTDRWSTVSPWLLFKPVKSLLVKKIPSRVRILLIQIPSRVRNLFMLIPSRVRSLVIKIPSRARSLLMLIPSLSIHVDPELNQKSIHVDPKLIQECGVEFFVDDRSETEEAMTYHVCSQQLTDLTAYPKDRWGNDYSRVWCEKNWRVEQNKTVQKHIKDVKARKKKMKELESLRR